MLADVATSLEQIEVGAWAEYLQRQRWFGGKGRQIAAVRLQDWAEIPGVEATVLGWLETAYTDGPAETYLLALGMRTRADDAERSVLRSDTLTVRDATDDPAFALALLDGIRSESVWPGRSGRFVCCRADAPEAQANTETAASNVRRVQGEQSNTSLVYDQSLILKLIRKGAAGLNPDAEVLEFLTAQAAFPHVPRFHGLIRYEPAGADELSTTSAILQRFLPNDGDGWSYVQRHLQAGHFDVVLEAAERLGAITAALHVALASDSTQPAFRPEPITLTEVAHWQELMRSQAEIVLGSLRRAHVPHLQQLGTTPDQIRTLEERCRALPDVLRLLATSPVMKIRVHGDYHLGQTLKTTDGFALVDFEGEPARPLTQRREKVCALKDVAGMLRSFDYAAHASGRHLRGASDRFLHGYLSHARPGTVSFLPAQEDALRQVLQAFLVDKAIYELGYELNNRPDWIAIPFHGLRRLIEV